MAKHYMFMLWRQSYSVLGTSQHAVLFCLRLIISHNPSPVNINMHNTYNILYVYIFFSAIPLYIVVLEQMDLCIKSCHFIKIINHCTYTLIFYFFILILCYNTSLFLCFCPYIFFKIA